MSVNPLLNIALRAARKAGEHIARAHGTLAASQIHAKAAYDFVTDIDRQAEKIIIDTIKRSYPTHAILAEESGEITHGNPQYQWIIDPLDGTTNFIFGIPHYAVSIAIAIEGKVQHGVVLDPIKQEEFTASRGAGAQLNNKRIRVSKRSSLEGSLLGTGIPFGDHPESKIDDYLSTLKAFLPHIAGIRRAGAASLDLAYVACGRLDGFWEMNLQPWDLAAGCLLVQEAGGLVSDFNAGHRYLETGNVICATPKVFKAMTQRIKAHTPQAATPHP